MKACFLQVMLLVLSIVSVHAAQQVDLPECKPGENKTSIPRWEVVADPVRDEAGNPVEFTYSVKYPPPASHGFMAHLRVQLGDLDEAACSQLGANLLEVKTQGQEPVPLIVQWRYEDNGPLTGETHMRFKEVPEFNGEGCWLDGVFQFVTLGDQSVESRRYILNLVPLSELQKTELFCRPIQEG
ncbi:hypothetical protein [Pseudovibrio sp. Tun.PSC04-5.I4]|uniref:hypothetical protein n=1 Tax=Pseudovibrio sp. Tun.PSC04-5.I4 TaxID=1798213 RepID=UPI00088F4CF1|nr:hypothetical protein [Pseudovibrio sp. Tun.PSC04-5.I4]SDR37674.1 hypothetical protein SAMN04515695_5113 [Pseudovibrio sp. Tun.PSC04-5.I4]